MAANTGRTTYKWIRFLVKDSGGTLREIPVNKVSVVGLVYEEVDLTAYQDAIKNALPGWPDCPIEIDGPFDTSVVQAAGGSGVGPALSGSHTVLYNLAGATTPLSLDVRFGMRQYWFTGEPQFGITSSATDGYICVAYTVDPSAGTYHAKFVLSPGSAAPAWGTAAET